jgi:hypothetical protein
MTAISLNPEKMTPLTVALFDRMSDGDWHDNQDLITYGAALAVESDRDEALKNGRRVCRKSLASGKDISEERLIESGAKDMVRNRLMIAVRGSRLERTKTHHRMGEETRLAWASIRPAASAQRFRIITDQPAETTSAPTSAARSTAALSLVADHNDDTVSTDPTAEKKTRKRRNNTAELVFGGIPEAEGWVSAPLVLKSRVHFHTEYGVPLDLDAFREFLPTDCEVSFDEGTGLYRVDCDHGTGTQIRDLIRDWCDTNGVKTKSLRAEHNLRRRTLTALDPTFLSDLCIHYAKYSQGRQRRHSTTLQFHFTDPDDLRQQIFEWVLEAVCRYDENSGVPFGAFLSEKISCWVHDLNRNKYGRILSDTELKYQRALQTFVTDNGRKPTETELAAAMGQEIGTFRKNAQVVATLQGLRNIGTLDVAPGESEVHLPDDEFSDDRYSDELQQSLLSQIMTTSCDVDKTARGKLKEMPNVLGWVAWYEQTWGGKNKTELSTGLSTSMRNMNEYTDRVRVRMERTGPEMLGA